MTQMEKNLRIGLVSPYGWDSPGGVQVHIRDLAKVLIAQGHFVSVLAPVSDEELLQDDFVVSAGKPVAIPYNGAVARVLFGPVVASRVRQWISSGNFDLLHIHEPAIPSLGLLACSIAEGPMVGTFHVAAPKFKVAFAIAPFVEPIVEKLRARIAVSEIARETLRVHLDTDAVVIPNGIHLQSFHGAYPRLEWQLGKTIGFIGRFDEKRKGLSVLLAALPELVRAHPDLKILIAGPGDEQALKSELPANVLERLTFLGVLTEAEKRQFFKSIELYVAPNVGGESFGIILAEAMATGTAILASDLPAFDYVLESGKWGELFETGNSVALAKKASALLSDPIKLQAMVDQSPKGAARFDWSVVAEEIIDVYQFVAREDERVVLAAETRTWSKIIKGFGT
jgi:phosphatidylinositol alpha-mannosyltransferase